MASHQAIERPKGADFRRLGPATSALASAFATGEQTIELCVIRASQTLGTIPEWLTPLAERYINMFHGRTRARTREVERWVRAELWAFVFPVEDRAEGEGIEDGDVYVDEETGEVFTLEVQRSDEWIERLATLRSELTLKSWLTESWRMQPVPSAKAWTIPVIESTAELAEWCVVSLDELQWFAGANVNDTFSSTASRLHHYHYRLTEKRSGGYRLIEAPQRRLKRIQRRILKEILEQVPNYYSAAHGFVKGRSVRTFAAPHVSKRVVLRMDLRNFFPTIGRARVQTVFRTLGYPETVANVLGGLCTNIAPRSLFKLVPRTAADVRMIYETKKLYTRPHLPQGAPTSPALANICAYRMDCRLTGLADWAGADYTRYADDIAFSGDETFVRSAERCSTEIAAITAAEGWSVQHRKTRVMRRGVRQQLAGIVVNDGMNVPRQDFDTLKAILTNCLRHGWQSQNRDGIPNFREHLAGRVGWVTSVNAAKGRKLRELFDRIAW